MAEFENVNELLAKRAEEYGDKTFLISERDGRSWSYSEFAGAVARASSLLMSRGITKGDTVSLLMPNSAEYIVAYFACWHIGAVAGPVNSLLKADEIEYVVKNSDSKLILTSAEFVASIAGDEGNAAACRF